MKSQKIKLAIELEEYALSQGWKISVTPTYFGRIKVTVYNELYTLTVEGHSKHEALSVAVNGFAQMLHLERKNHVALAF